MLHWNTVTGLLKETPLKLIQAEEFNDFRLVGGTALSLQLGHRISMDIDLFTGAPYGSIDFDVFGAYLNNNFAKVEGEFGANPGMGKSYLIGSDSDALITLDLYYSMDPFFQEAGKKYIQNLINRTESKTVEWEFSVFFVSRAALDSLRGLYASFK